MALATWQDVAVALGRPISTPAEQGQVEWWLSGVELFIVARLGPIADLDQDIVRYVEVEAVAAKVRRSGTLESSVTVALDDGNITRRYENAVTAGDITDEWWNLLDPTIGSGAYAVRPYFEADNVRWPVSTPPSYDTDREWR